MEKRLNKPKIQGSQPLAVTLNNGTASCHSRVLHSSGMVPPPPGALTAAWNGVITLKNISWAMWNCNSISGRKPSLRQQDTRAISGSELLESVHNTFIFIFLSCLGNYFFDRLFVNPVILTLILWYKYHRKVYSSLNESPMKCGGQLPHSQVRWSARDVYQQWWHVWVGSGAGWGLDDFGRCLSLRPVSVNTLCVFT